MLTQEELDKLPEVKNMAVALSKDPTGLYYDKDGYTEWLVGYVNGQLVKVKSCLTP